jgi:hypothetical protein
LIISEPLSPLSSFLLSPELIYRPSSIPSYSPEHIPSFSLFFPSGTQTLGEEAFKTFYNPSFDHQKLLLDIMAGNVNQPNKPNQPPPPPPRVFNKAATRYAPIVLPANLNDLPDNYLKMLPKFSSENEVTTCRKFSLF